MFEIIWKSFLSGIHFYISIFKDNFVWIFAIIFLILLYFEDSKDIEEMYMDDEREIF